MRIEFPLLSILATALLAFLVFQGSNVELHSLEIGFSAMSSEARIMVDPVWVVWADSPLVNTVLGTTFGNVSIVKKSLCGTVKGRCVQAYELNHIYQYYALGWWIYPFSLFTPIEASLSSEIWLPPPFWIDQWRFLSLKIRH